MNETTVSCASVPVASQRTSNLVVAALALLFVVMLLPTLSRDLGYFADESYYTDVAIRMTQTGDYLIPHYLYDGQPHFNKPIVTYWMIAASYMLLGINFFSSRLPSVIAGAVIVWLTWRLALMLFHDRKAAYLSAFIMLSNFLLINYSTCSMPDIYLTLFLTASFYGFAAILFDNDRSLLNYLLAYVGAGLAIETKGTHGLLLVAYVFIFCTLLRNRVGAKCRQLLEWKAVVAGLVVAFAWFVVIYLQFGSWAIVGHPGLSDGFLADQFGDEVSRKGFRPLHNAFFYIQSPCSHFVPWIFFLLIGVIPDRALFARFWKEHSFKILFVLAWTGLLILVFAMAKQVRGRYLMPAYPMLAAVLGALLAKLLQEGKTSGWIRALCRAITMVPALFGIVLLIAGFWMGWLFIAGGIALMAIAGGSFVVGFRGSDALHFGGLALSLLLTVSLYTTLVRPALDASPLPAMAQKLAREGMDGRQVAGVGLPSRAASQINVLSQGRIQIKLFTGDKVSFADIQDYPALLLSQGYLDKWEMKAYDAQPCGYTYAEWSPTDIRHLLKSRSLDAVLLQKKVWFYFVTKKPPAQAQAH